LYEQPACLTRNEMNRVNQRLQQREKPPLQQNFLHFYWATKKIALFVGRPSPVKWRPSLLRETPRHGARILKFEEISDPDSKILIQERSRKLQLRAPLRPMQSQCWVLSSGRRTLCVHSSRMQGSETGGCCSMEPIVWNRKATGDLKIAQA